VCSPSCVSGSSQLSPAKHTSFFFPHNPRSAGILSSIPGIKLNLQITTKIIQEIITRPTINEDRGILLNPTDPDKKSPKENELEVSDIIQNFKTS
jgi:hypothetical protein